jgi:hypothetical protein
MSDFHLDNHGTISLLTPTSRAGQDWAGEYLPDDVMTFGRNAVVIEHRYVADIIAGIIEANLTIDGE